MDTNGQLTRNWIPGVLVHFPNGRITERHLCHFIISASRPENFNFFAFRVRNDLTANISLIGLVEDIDSIIYDDVGKVNLFIWRKTHLLNSKCFTTSQARSTSEKLFDIGGLGHVVPGRSHLTIELLDVLHGPRSIIGWNGARLSDGVDVSHVVDGWRWVRMECLDVRVDVLSPIINKNSMG